MSKKQVQIKNLQVHVDALCAHLKEMGYSEYTIRKTNSVLNRYILFAENAGIQFHDNFCTQNFILANLGDDYQSKYHSYTITRPLAMLDDFLTLGTVFRQKYAGFSEFTEAFAEPFESFLAYLTSRNYAQASVRNCRSHLLRFQNYLLDNGVSDPCFITHDLVKQYADSLVIYSTTTNCQITRDMRNFFSYAKAHEILKEDFSPDLPHFKNTRGQRLPDRLTAEEINKIVNMIDRNNPLGKRDYAIVLIAVRLGLRNSDVTSLKFSSVDWAKKELHIVQIKTGVPLSLPLPDDVGWAIIDYIRNSRPNSVSDNIFVSHTPPYNGLTQYTNYVAKYMRKAGIYSNEKRRVGMHTLRRSLATTMLENDVPVTVIAQTLGHGDLNTVGKYIRISTKLLKQCAMEVDCFE